MPFETIVFTDRQVSLVGAQPNRAPTLVNAIADQTAIVDTSFGFTLPTNVFADADGDTLARTAVLADGNPLPSWLSFNPTTGMFSGTPTSAQVGTLSVRVIATDPGGLAASDVFDIRINPVSTPETLYTNVAGTQILTGTTANDVFVLGAASTGYQWGETQDGSGTVVWNANGYDILYGFEQLRFTNKSVTLTAAVPGTYTDDPDLVQHLTGKTANDVFVIAGPSADYDWGPTSDNAGVVIWTVSATDDTYDILKGFEAIQFEDQTIDLA